MMNKGTIYKSTFRAALRAVALHMSKDVTRQHLCGVRIEFHDHSVRLVATDGHTLAMAEVPCGRCADVGEPVLLSSSDVKELIKMLPAGNKGPETVSIERSEGCLTVGYNGASRVCVLVDMPFPPYENVLPKVYRYLDVEVDGKPASLEVAIPVVGANPEYLARIGKACNEINGSKKYARAGVEIRQCQELDPILFTFEKDGISLTQVVMPMRI